MVGIGEKNADWLAEGLDLLENGGFDLQRIDENNSLARLQCITVKIDLPLRVKTCPTVEILRDFPQFDRRFQIHNSPLKAIPVAARTPKLLTRSD
jgi:hypothetical protein